jgi:hypothetical protein
MSFLRLAFWLALLVLLLPTDAYQQARLTNFANTAVERFSTFCDRNGRTCAAGDGLWATFLKKAEFGVRLVGDLLGAGGRQVPVSRPELPPNAPPPPPDHRSGRADPRGTLPPSDANHPAWRGPSRSGGG